MKKGIIVWLVSFCLLVGLVGCSSSKSSNTNTKMNEPSLQGRWISDDLTINITGSSLKFSTGETWRYKIVNNYQMEVTVDGKKAVIEYNLSYDSLTIGGLSTGSVTLHR